MNVLRQPAINSLRHLKLSGRPKFRQFNSWPRLLSVAPLKPATKVPVGESKVLLGKLFGLVWAERDTKIKVRILFAFGLLLAGKSCMVLTPLIYKQIIDTCNAAPNEALTMLGLLCGGYGLARLSAFAFQEFRNAVFASVSQRTMRTISKRVYNHLLYLDQEFHSSSVTGGLLRSIDRGTKGINQVLSALVFHIIPTTFELSIVCGLLYSYFGVEYMVITFATVALYSIFTVVTTRWRLKFRKRMNIADNKAGAKATDTLLNIEQIQLMNSQPFATEQYDKALMDYETAAVKSITSLSFLNAGQSTIFSIALGLQLYMASEGVITGSMTVGDVVMINSLLFQLSFPLNFLGSVYRDTRQSLVDMKTMFELLEIKSKIIDSRKLSKFEYKNGDIYLDDVYFQYDDGRQVLHGLSLHIPAGKTVAFVGPSGCGKSTILRLITRLYDPSRGTIKIDGRDIQTVDLTSLREVIGVVPQDTILFNGSIYNNIRYGNPQATEADVIEAARKAELHKIIHKFPQQYETVVGERGVMMSGGEKQRVQISRLFVKNSPIALFDEPTSALDTNTEIHLMNTIRNWVKGGEKHRTAVFIAHRLSTIRDCDLIFILKDGKLFEQGTHDELMDMKGLYYDMLMAQTA